MTGKSFAKRASFGAFLTLDRIGVHLLPKHYYNPVPDYVWLRKNIATWSRRTSMTGVEWDLDAQLEWLRECCLPYYGEVRGLEFYEATTRGDFGPGFGALESQLLHCFIRKFRPARVIEIGGGVSTVCAMRAVEMNVAGGGPETKVRCIEPWPHRGLEKIAGVDLIRKRAQGIDRSCFDRLHAGDLLSVDSTHAVKTGSDVLAIYLDIIPSLPPGVFIHVHDVFLPYVYQRDALTSYRSWQENALLLALLKGNRGLHPLCCMSALHYDRRSELGEVLTDYIPQPEIREGLAAPGAAGHFPASLWLKTCKPEGTSK